MKNRKKYNNAFLGRFFDKLGDRFDVQTEAKEANAQADLLKAQTMNQLANQPAQGINPLLIIIPAVVLVIGGITIFILLKKKG